MKTFADCKVGDEMYIMGIPVQVEHIVKIEPYKDSQVYIDTENHRFLCTKDDECNYYMHCNRETVIKESEKHLNHFKTLISIIQQSINDLKEI
jgi:hypothetical protein